MTDLLTIDHVGRRGDGVAATPTGAVFVPYTLPGETVAVEAGDDAARRKLTALVTPGTDRVAAICPHFGDCGGCATQHWRMKPYLAWKRSLVVEALQAQALDARVDPCIDAHGAGRRRVTFHARGTDVGFMAAHSHRLVAITQCPVLSPALARALPVARAIAQRLGSAKPLDIRITATDTGLDVDLRGSGPLRRIERTALAMLGGEHDLARLTRHGEMVAQRAEPVLCIGTARVVPPPGVFLQATLAGEETLAQIVLHHTRGATKVADLFCGIGTFALRLAGTARVTAADSDAAAIEALKSAAAGLKPIGAQARDLFRQPLTARELTGHDAVVFDPPRQGAEAQVREIAQSKVPVVVAVSCDPATFARDLRSLVTSDYRITRVTPVDQFRYSPHVEMVARLEKT